jgi:integrase
MDSHPGDLFKYRQRKMLPQCIPQEVLTQLHKHLDSLPVQIRRMLILLQECGIRLNELCSISFDCLDRDSAGNWFIRYKRLKIKEECKIPVSNKATTIIIEQQESLFTKLGKVPRFLFSNRKGQPFSQQTFLGNLNRMAYKWDIRDATGAIWRFQARQFYDIKQLRMNVISSSAHLFAHHSSQEWVAYHLSQESRDELAALLSQTWSANPLRFGYCTLPSRPCLYNFGLILPLIFIISQFQTLTR